MEEIVKLTKNGVVQYPITKPETVVDEAGATLIQKLEEKAYRDEIPTKLSQLENDIAIWDDDANVIEIGFFNLHEQASENQLIPEQKYRIIDYDANFQFANGGSAHHQFDIIVRAKNTHELYKEARAAKHEGDTYFANSNLAEWKLWYEFTDETIEDFMLPNYYAFCGGAITRMIDEFGNDLPYDFKNAIFYNFNGNEMPSGGRPTFCSGVGKDDNSITGNIRNVKFDACINIFRAGSCSNSIFINSNNMLWDNVHNATFINCDRNKFSSQIIDSNIIDSATNEFFKDINSSTITGCSGNVFDGQISSSYIKDCKNSWFKYGIVHSTVTNISYKGDYPNQAIPYLYYTTLVTDEHTFINENGITLPIKHPDLSTQPSILSYTCMGFYVFEYLIPYHNNNVIECELQYNKPLILSCDIVGIGIKTGCDVVEYANGVLVIEPSREVYSDNPLFIKITYTSLEPKNPCDPYGYGCVYNN